MSSKVFPSSRVASVTVNTATLEPAAAGGNAALGGIGKRLAIGISISIN